MAKQHWVIHETPTDGHFKNQIIMGGYKHCAACGKLPGGYVIPKKGFYANRYVCGTCWEVYPRRYDIPPYVPKKCDSWC